mmetsp:Transcript_13246/g.36327  ORF Transcript_13246/g.36327 Transcript_13246/m.36327 type:complete len:351 (-) Transcript_13246:200-1252(-)
MAAVPDQRDKRALLDAQVLVCQNGLQKIRLSSDKLPSQDDRQHLDLDGDGVERGAAGGQRGCVLPEALAQAQIPQSLLPTPSHSIQAVRLHVDVLDDALQRRGGVERIQASCIDLCPDRTKRGQDPQARQEHARGHMAIDDVRAGHDHKDAQEDTREPPDVIPVVLQSQENIPVGSAIFRHHALVLLHVVPSATVIRNQSEVGHNVGDVVLDGTVFFNSPFQYFFGHLQASGNDDGHEDGKQGHLDRCQGGFARSENTGCRRLERNAHHDLAEQLHDLDEAHVAGLDQQISIGGHRRHQLAAVRHLVARRIGVVEERLRQATHQLHSGLSGNTPGELHTVEVVQHARADH